MGAIASLGPKDVKNRCPSIDGVAELGYRVFRMIQGMII